MSVYYISACHDCKTTVMWSKVTEQLAQQWHNNYHRGHCTEFGHDEDDEFYYDRTSGYKDEGIADGDDFPSRSESPIKDL